MTKPKYKITGKIEFEILSHKFREYPLTKKLGDGRRANDKLPQIDDNLFNNCFDNIDFAEKTLQALNEYKYLHNFNELDDVIITGASISLVSNKIYKTDIEINGVYFDLLGNRMLTQQEYEDRKKRWQE